MEPGLQRTRKLETSLGRKSRSGRFAASIPGTALRSANPLTAALCGITPVLSLQVTVTDNAQPETYGNSRPQSARGNSANPAGSTPFTTGPPNQMPPFSQSPLHEIS